MHTAYKFRHYNGDGELLWASSIGDMEGSGFSKGRDLEVIREQDWELNTLVDEGEKDILDVYFDDVAVRTTLYFRLYDITGPAETDTLTTISAEEITGTDYTGVAVTRGTDWTDPALDSGDMRTVSSTKTFTAGGTWDTANQLVLATVQTGTAGLFIAYVALSAARTLLINDTLDVTMGVKLA
jgi:hypothetical protein